MQLFKNVLSISVCALLLSAHLLAVEASTELRSTNPVVRDSISDLDDQLIRAIIKGDVKAVKAFIAAGANANAYIPGTTKELYAENKYQTVLILAARRGHPDIVKALLAAGADVNGVCNLMGTNALMLAAQQDHADIVKILIAGGADIEASGLTGRTALLEAARGKYDELDRDSTINAVRALIGAGANVNATDCNGTTPLMEAAKHNHFNTVLVLIDSGVDVNVKDVVGMTALDWAEHQGALQAGRILYSLKGD